MNSENVARILLTCFQNFLLTRIKNYFLPMPNPLSFAIRKQKINGNEERER